MFKPSLRSIITLGTVLVLLAAVPGVAFAKHGNNNSTAQGGGPPACRELSNDLSQIQIDLASVKSDISSFSATLTAMNQTIISIQQNTSNFAADLHDVLTALQEIQATLQAQGIGGLQVDVTVDETACASGVVQCASATPANSTNQNPVALNVLVMKGGQPVTNLTGTNFQITTDFAPTGGGNLVVCSSGDQGCGTASFFVNTGNGAYQLWLSPTSNWVPGTYTLQLKVTDTSGTTTTKLVKVFIGS